MVSDHDSVSKINDYGQPFLQDYKQQQFLYQYASQTCFLIEKIIVVCGILAGDGNEGGCEKKGKLLCFVQEKVCRQCSKRVAPQGVFHSPNEMLLVGSQSSTLLSNAKYW